MTVAPQNPQKFALSELPKLGTTQVSQPQRAVSALARESTSGAPLPHLEKAAHELIAQTFFGTLLKQTHNSPFKSDLFSGGRGEEAFAPMYDQHMAQRMARGAGEQLVRPIVKKFQKAAEEAYRKQQMKKEADFVSANRRA